MSYRIEYEGYQEKHDLQTGWTVRRFFMTGLCFSLFAMMVCHFWPEGREVMMRLFIPGEPEQTLQAVECFTRALKGGEGLKEAVTTFCHTVFAGEG